MLTKKDWDHVKIIIQDELEACERAFGGNGLGTGFGARAAVAYHEQLSELYKRVEAASLPILIGLRSGEESGASKAPGADPVAEATVIARRFTRDPGSPHS